MISVIIPVYNVERYLRACVDNVRRQTFRDLEIILVDDGSTDSSGRMCDELAGEDRRVRVIHKKNEGLGAARNTGLALARGEYLCFIDSDDGVAPVFMECLAGMIEETGADVATCGLLRFTGETLPEISLSDRRHRNFKIITGSEAICDVLYQNGALDCSSSGKLYRTDLFKDKKFPVGRLYEDLRLIPTVLLGARRIAICDYKLYFYRYTPGSITHTLSKRRFDAVYMAEELERELAEVAANHAPANESLPRLIGRAASDRVLSASFNMLALMISHPEIADEAFRRRCENNISRHWKASLTDRNVRLKNKAGIILYKFMPGAFFRFISKRIY